MCLPGVAGSYTSNNDHIGIGRIYSSRNQSVRLVSLFQRNLVTLCLRFDDPTASAVVIRRHRAKKQTAVTEPSTPVEQVIDEESTMFLDEKSDNDGMQF